eukprot:5195032-Alexandrium_andersonii.AAC.1
MLECADSPGKPSLIIVDAHLKLVQPVAQPLAPALSPGLHAPGEERLENLGRVRELMRRAGSSAAPDKQRGPEGTTPKA